MADLSSRLVFDGPDDELGHQLQRDDHVGQESSNADTLSYFRPQHEQQRYVLFRKECFKLFLSLVFDN